MGNSFNDLWPGQKQPSQRRDSASLIVPFLTIFQTSQVTYISFLFQPSLPKVNTTERLAELRKLMQREGVQAYIVPSVDQHMVI